jgi:hypothetical protein
MNITKYFLAPNPRIVRATSLDDELFVTIKIGNGQAGGSRVKLEGKVVVKGDLEVTSPIGTVRELQNKVLKFKTNVTDINLSTNRCVITTEFTNHQHEIVFQETDEGDAPPNGMASFVGKYVVQVG